MVSAIGDGVLCGACGLPAAHLPLNFSEGHGQFCRSCVQSLLQDEGISQDAKHAACSDSHAA